MKTLGTCDRDAAAKRHPRLSGTSRHDGTREASTAGLRRIDRRESAAAIDARMIAWASARQLLICSYVNVSDIPVMSLRYPLLS